MTILVSTTRQWNPGDEFILWGVKNLLGLKYFAIFDRNPDLYASSVATWSNCWTARESIDPFSSIVIAGTPEWGGERLKFLFEEINRTKKPVYFIGIGGSVFELSDLEKSILTAAKIITTRDINTKNMIEHAVKCKAHCLPCPSLFCVENADKVKNIKKIGIVLQFADAVYGQAVKENISNLGLELIKDLKGNYEVSVIHHYFRELRTKIPDVDVFYSYRAEDYPEIYRNFDFIISTRLHGALLSAALEIPTILINDDKRCTNAIAIVPPIKTCLSISDVKSVLQSFNLENWYENIEQTKRNAWAEWQRLQVLYNLCAKWV